MTGTSATPNSSRTEETPVRGNAPELKDERERLPFGVSIFLTPRRSAGGGGRAGGSRRVAATLPAGPRAPAGLPLAPRGGRCESSGERCRQNYRHAKQKTPPFYLQFGGVATNVNFSRSRRVRDSRDPSHDGLKIQLRFSRRKSIKSTSSGPEVPMDLQVHFKR